MFYQWRPYVSVAQRRANAQKALQARTKKGLKADPVTISGRKIATTYWGQLWCDAMEAEADWANRLPRGRTYARNGSVVHLEMNSGAITAIVSGSELYDVVVQVRPLSTARWQVIRGACGAGVSALSLLQGRLDDAAMRALTAPGRGMIPERGDFTFRCSCPDYASLCKHVAAVLYGVGSRLDRDPALLFTLRSVNMNELVAAAGSALTTAHTASTLGDDPLDELFGIDLAPAPAPRAKPSAPAPAPAPKAVKARATRPAPTPTASSAPPPGLSSGKLYAAAELRALGISQARIKKLVAEGHLLRDGFGWYRAP